MILRKKFLVISYHVTAVVRLVIGILNNHVEDGGTENVGHLKKLLKRYPGYLDPLYLPNVGEF